MKKIIWLLIFVLFIVIPVKVNAYGIENYYINANALENGDLEVEEYYYLNGDYNGTTREILYKNDSLLPFNSSLNYYGGSALNNGSNIEIENIIGLDQSSNFDFTNIDGDVFRKVSYADKGDYGVYESTRQSGGIFLKIYVPSTKHKAIYIKYKIKDIAILHNDVGELFWTIFNNNSSESIGNLKITINFPNNKDEFRVWAHGPLHGEVKKDGNNKLIATVRGLSAYRAVDVRAVFDKNVIKESNKKSNVNALEKILNYEESKANQANYERVQNIENSFVYCESYPTRTCYNDLSYNVRLITDKELKQKYEKRLESLYTAVILKEQETAINAVENAELFLDYNHLKDAESKVEILEEGNLKTSLENRLQIVEDKIIEKETRREKKFKLSLITFNIISIILIIYIYLKFDKEYKKEFKDDYYREIPQGYTPTLLSYLLKKKITNDSISATVLQLINKKVILYEKDVSGKYVLKKNNHDNSNINDIENKVIKLLFEYGNELKLKDMKKLAKKHYETYKSNYESIVRVAKNEGKKRKIYENEDARTYRDINHKTKWYWIVLIILHCTPLMIIALFIDILLIPILLMYKFIQNIKDVRDGYLPKLMFMKYLTKVYLGLAYILEFIIMIIVLACNHYVRFSFRLILLNFVIQIFLGIYINLVKKRTEQANEDYHKWKAFKRFLNDFGKFDDKDLPEVSLWEEYLVYAHVLGISKKLIKDMKLKEISELDNNIINSGDFYVLSSVLNSSLHTAYSTAVAAKRAHDYSSYSGSSGGSWSSGSGGGGGFSSGGSSGGGGGSVGRF